VLCVSSYASCDSLQNRFIPFQFAITFYKIFGFHLETALTTRSLIVRIQLKFVIIETKKLTATSHTIRLNKPQSAICAPLYKTRCFKHCKFNQPYGITAQNPCNPW